MDWSERKRGEFRERGIQECFNYPYQCNKCLEYGVFE